jgi:hypothetical protein
MAGGADPPDEPPGGADPPDGPEPLGAFLRDPESRMKASSRSVVVAGRPMNSHAPARIALTTVLGLNIAPTAKIATSLVAA